MRCLVVGDGKGATVASHSGDGEGRNGEEWTSATDRGAGAVASATGVLELLKISVLLGKTKTGVSLFIKIAFV